MTLIHVVSTTRSNAATGTPGATVVGAYRDAAVAEAVRSVDGGDVTPLELDAVSPRQAQYLAAMGVSAPMPSDCGGEHF